jgi:sec-independent protein translocase protein TatB
MFLDIGWSEMAIILLVALIVIGPKDLPKLARSIGRWTAKARSMARDFQRSLDDMAREAELDEIRSELNKVRPGNLSQTIRDTVDPDGEMERAFDVHDNAPRAAPAKPSPAPEAPKIAPGESGTNTEASETVKQPATADAASKTDDVKT